MIAAGSSGAASGISNASSRLSGVLAVAIFGGVAGLVFAWSAPAGTSFGLIPPLDDPARDVIEGAFVAGYSTALIFAAIWCLIAAVVSFIALQGTGPARPAAAETGTTG